MLETKTIKYMGGMACDVPDFRLQFEYNVPVVLSKQIAERILLEYQDFEEVKSEKQAKTKGDE